MRVLVISNQLSSKSDKVVNPVIKNLNRILNQKKVAVHEYCVESDMGVLFSYVKLFLYLLGLKFKSDNFDIYHVHFGGVQGLITSFLFGSKTIISFHGTDLHGGSPLTLKGKVKSKIVRLSSVLSIYLSMKSTVVSENLICFIPKCFRSKLIVIPTGVNQSDFLKISREAAREFLGINDDFVYFLFSDISNSDVKRLDLAEKVIESLNLLGVNARLLKMNQVPYHVVPYYLYASDYLLITSDKEGSPNIVKEALFCNVGVISTDVGDVKKYVEHTGNGFIFENRMPELMAKAIFEYMSMDSGEGKNYSKDILSLDYVVDKYLGLYEEIC